MQKISSVCVYCGTGADVNPLFRQTAEDLGKTLANSNLALVYGGGRVGLMGLVAKGATENGGHVVGVIPAHIQDKEERNDDISEVHIVDSMHTRKMMMAERSDAFVVLPGGMGTLDEMFEILTWKYLRLHDKPVIILNVGGYYDPLVAMLRHMSVQGFTPAWQLELFTVATSIDEAMAALAISPPSTLKTDTAHM